MGDLDGDMVHGMAGVFTGVTGGDLGGIGVGAGVKGNAGECFVSKGEGLGESGGLAEGVSGPVGNLDDSGFRACVAGDDDVMCGLGEGTGADLAGDDKSSVGDLGERVGVDSSWGVTGDAVDEETLDFLVYCGGFNGSGGGPVEECGDDGCEEDTCVEEQDRGKVFETIFVIDEGFVLGFEA